MIKFIFTFIEWLFYKLGKQVIVADRDCNGMQKDRPYLVRTIIAQNKYFSIYLHRFLCSDLETFHDHPWNFFTYVISGGYVEESIKRTSCLQVENAAFFNDDVIKIKRAPGSIKYRRCGDVHRVIVDKERCLRDINDAPFTLCIIGPRKREWGFWKYATSVPGVNEHIREFIPWKEFLKLTDKQTDHYEKRA